MSNDANLPGISQTSLLLLLLLLRRPACSSYGLRARPHTSAHGIWMQGRHKVCLPFSSNSSKRPRRRPGETLVHPAAVLSLPTRTGWSHMPSRLRCSAG